MSHSTPLIATIVAGLVLAFVFATIANRLRLPPIVGYLFAGIVAGPFTPGIVADSDLASQLAEIGVILLMFGVGLHFSLRDLLSVRAIAIPGALVQIAVATALGWALARWAGWDNTAGIVFGLALSVASTVVLLRAMTERHLLETERGRIAVGWLIVEDLAMVLALVLLPALPMLSQVEIAEGMAQAASDLGGVLSAIAITIGKVAVFVALMLVVGRRLVPMLLHYVAYSGSRELFRLAVLAIALGFAYGAAMLFDVSFALGAFFAGMILAESELSQQAAQESLPLRDAFAVLFFVSVGMLFDPMIVVRETWFVLATLGIIVLGKSAAAYVIVRLFRHPHSTALTISASLAQIGEFSFILAALGVELGMLPPEGRDLILAGAILSIVLNPLFFVAAERLVAGTEEGKAEHPVQVDEVAVEPAPPPIELAAHAILVGYGRVGSIAAAELKQLGVPVLIIEDNDELGALARTRGFAVLTENAVRRSVLTTANLTEAKWLLIAIPNAFEAGRVVQQARTINPFLAIVARAHSDAEVAHLKSLGASHVIMGEREIALGMVGYIDATRMAAGTSD